MHSYKRIGLLAKYLRRMYNVAGDLSVVVYCFFVCMFVCHSVNEINQVWQHISYIDCHNGTKLGKLIDRALLCISSKTGEL